MDQSINPSISASPIFRNPEFIYRIFTYGQRIYPRFSSWIYSFRLNSFTHTKIHWIGFFFIYTRKLYIQFVSEPVFQSPKAWYIFNWPCMTPTCPNDLYLSSVSLFFPVFSLPCPIYALHAYIYIYTKIHEPFWFRST